MHTSADRRKRLRKLLTVVAGSAVITLAVSPLQVAAAADGDLLR